MRTHTLVGRQRVIAIAVLAVLYWASGRAGLTFATIHANVTLVWPPTGLALSALILWGPGLWPGVLLGALALNRFMALPESTVLGIALGNTLEAVTGAWLLRRADFRPGFARLRDVAAFLGLGVGACTLVSATIGVASLMSFGGIGVEGDWSKIWVVWWLGDAGGALVVVPLVLLLRRGAPNWGELWRRREAWVLIALLSGAAGIAFGSDLRLSTAMMLAFLPFPFVAWAGSRLESRGAMLAAAMTAVIAVAGTRMGHGPFALFDDPFVSITLLWFYCVTMATVALAMAAAIAERSHAVAARIDESEDRRRLEQRVHQQQRLESLGLLAGGVAHDFNNILTAIRGNAELLEWNVREDAEAKLMLGEIQIAADRAAGMCRRLLAYAGRRRPSKAPVDLPELLAELKALVGPSVSKRVEIYTSGAATGTVVGDASLLRQVFMNLMLNAAEAIGDRPGAVRVETKLIELDRGELDRMIASYDSVAGEFICVEVRDDGCGMSEDTLARIFDPFFSTKFTGRGLGLAAVLGIVRSHGGAIDVVSEPRRGTVFRVCLPMYDGAAPDSSQIETDEIRDGQNRCILVADDEPAVLAVTVRVLEAVGYVVLTAEDGDAAVSVFREKAESIDLVLFDIAMPGADGVQALREVHGMAPGLPSILMSGHDENSKRAQQAGGRFLGKPFSSRELLECVHRALSRVRRRAN